MARLSVFLPRLVALTVAWLLATTALTYAAAKRMTVGGSSSRMVTDTDPPYE